MQETKSVVTENLSFEYRDVTVLLVFFEFFDHQDYNARKKTNFFSMNHWCTSECFGYALDESIGIRVFGKM